MSRKMLRWSKLGNMIVSKNFTRSEELEKRKLENKRKKQNLREHFPGERHGRGKLLDVYLS